jgi:hypothetical protein
MGEFNKVKFYYHLLSVLIEWSVKQRAIFWWPVYTHDKLLNYLQKLRTSNNEEQRQKFAAMEPNS